MVIVCVVEASKVACFCVFRFFLVVMVRHNDACAGEDSEPQHSSFGDASSLRQRFYGQADGFGGTAQEVPDVLASHFKNSAIRPCSVRGQCARAAQMGWVPAQRSAALRVDEGNTFAHRLPMVEKRIPQRAGERTQRSVAPVTQLKSHSPTPSGELPRYRRIEDLALYLSQGVVDEQTEYFEDPMVRRARIEANAAAVPQVAVVPGPDPRTTLRRSEDSDSPVRVRLPKRVQESKREYEQTTGMVRPYALGRTCRTTTMTAPMQSELTGNALDSFVTTMQCQRPTKGLFTYC